MDSIENLGDGLGRRRRRHARKHSALGRRARRGSGCSAAGVKANGRLKKGFRWAKGRKGCAVRARKHRK
jgi:hypothetical protein